MNSSRALSGFLCVMLACACGGGVGIAQDPVCGNEIVEPDELCDTNDLSGQSCESLNLGGGTLACGDDCSFDVSGCDVHADCGNGAVEFPEQCDGDDLDGLGCVDLGFDSGTLGCTLGCTFNTAACVVQTICDGAELEPGEECDGAHLDGATCESLGLGVGTLGCDSNCHFDVSGCEVQSVCGNGTHEHPEVCDGLDLGGMACTDVGFYGGELGCDPDCNAFDTTLCAGACGDGLVNGPELCDGMDLGGESCESQGLHPGVLGCAVGCAAFDLVGCGGMCGDGVLNGPELCDTGDFGGDNCQAHGFYAGTLQCATDCGTIDDSGCAGLCGDGLINGPEVCDGADVGPAVCPNGGQAVCLPDCSGVSCVAVLITEVSMGDPDWVELTNVSAQPVTINGWYIQWQAYDQNDQPVAGTFVVPMMAPTPVTLQPGDRVVLQDEYGGDGSPPDINLPYINFHDNIWWGSDAGAVTLFDAGDQPLDFVRWGGPDFSPPAGANWSDVPAELFGLNSNSHGISRQPDEVDTDTAGDWCVAAQTPTTANGLCEIIAGPGTLLLTEVDAGGPDRLELYNPGNVTVDLDGWYILWLWGNQYGYILLPSFPLAGGAYVEIVDDCTSNCPTLDAGGVIHIDNLPWWNGGLGQLDSGACRLLEPVALTGVDFVRWGGTTWGPQSPDSWSETTPLPAIPQGVSLGRHSLVDTDTEADWCLLDTHSFGGPNVSNDPFDPDPCQ